MLLSWLYGRELSSGEGELEGQREHGERVRVIALMEQGLGLVPDVNSGV